MSTATAGFQLCVPRSPERAPPAGHYLINLQGFGLCKCRTCGTAAPRGLARRAGKHDPTDIKSSPFSGGSLPSPRAAGRGLGNRSLFVLSRPFWTTFSVFMRAICSPGKGKRPPAARPPLLSARGLAPLPFGPAAARAGRCWRGGFWFPLQDSGEGSAGGGGLPLLPRSGTAALFLTEVFLKTCSSLTKQLWVRSFSQEFYMWKTGH